MIILDEYYFDIRLGIETRKRVFPENLSVDEKKRKFAREYAPTNAYIFRKEFRKFSYKEFKGGAWVDFGCGKGKALLLAAEIGFQRIVGVEYAPELCAACRKNIEVYKRKTGSKASFQVINNDASTVALPEDASLFYFNNPFSEVIIGEVILRIKESISKSPRKALIVYYAPEHRRLFEADPYFNKIYESVNLACYLINESPGEWKAGAS